MIELGAIRIDTAVPFRLELELEGSGCRELTCEELLRVLPGRRVVARACLDGLSVVVKLFIGANPGKYYRRELRGLEQLESAGVPVPERLALVAGSRRPGDGVVGLVSRYLQQAAPVDPLDDEAIADVVRLLGRMHDSGSRHADPHLHNFLRAAGRTYAVDGDGVRRAVPPVGPRRSLRELGLLLAQRPPARDAAASALGAAYRRERGWQEDPAWQEGLGRALTRQRAARVARFLAKSLRDCTEFAVASSWRERRVLLRSCLSELEPVLDAPEDWLAAGQRLKSGNSATVARIAVPEGRTWVLKRYNVKSAAHGLRRQLKRTPRWRNAWLAGQRLRFLNLPVARPVALLERRFGPLRGVAYLIMEDLGDLNLAAEVACAGLEPKRLAQVTELFTLLRQVGLTHTDTKATNFLVADDQLHLIDLDGMRSGLAHFDADLERFLDNWTGAERRRFEAAFAGAGLR